MNINKLNIPILKNVPSYIQYKGINNTIYSGLKYKQRMINNNLFGLQIYCYEKK